MIFLEYFFGLRKNEKEQLTASESGETDAREKQLLREAIEAYRRAIEDLDRAA